MMLQAYGVRKEGQRIRDSGFFAPITSPREGKLTDP